MTNQFNVEQLRQAAEYLKNSTQTEDKSLAAKRIYISRILTLILKSNDCWYSDCPFSYFVLKEKIQDELHKLVSGKYNDEIHMDSILLDCMYFVREKILSVQRKYPETYKNYSYGNENLNELWQWFIKLDLNSINKIYHEDFFYIKNELAISIFNYHLGGKPFQAFLNFEENVSRLEEKSKELEQKIQDETNKADTKIREVQRLETALKTYKEGFNFVGLSNGFSNLLIKKENSKNCMFWLLVLIGIFIVIIPFIKVVSETNWAEITWQQLLIGIGLEFVLIYFFRVVLNHYRAAETQIMQLELRLSLCQFIQNYAEYAKEIKTNDSGALEKFENLIFSSILSTDEKIPSTFDGMEQITNLIKELKGKP